VPFELASVDLEGSMTGDEDDIPISEEDIRVNEML